MLFAQAPEMEWFKAQGSNTEEHVHEGFQTSDGGYIAIGHGIERSDFDDMLIIKTDKNGSLLWKQSFGTRDKDGTGYCITEVSDGYVAGGAIYDSFNKRTQRFLAKLDFAGNRVWIKYYRAQGLGGIRGIDATRDGGLVVTGYTNAPDISEFRGFVFIVDDGDGFIMKLDAEGKLEWEKTIDAAQGTKVRELDDGYTVCSCVWNWSEDAGDHLDFCLIKTDKKGNTVWRKTYGGSKGDHLYDFDLTTDGGYILAGHTVSYGVDNWDYLLMKIDREGEEEWHRIFGQPRGYDARWIHDEAYGVRQTPDGGYVICGGSGDEYAGYSKSDHPAGSSDEWKVYLVKTDPNGETLWEGIYPPNPVGNNGGEYIGLTQDDGYIVFVDTDSQSPPAPNNYGFMKLATDLTDVPGDQRFQTVTLFELHQNYPNPFNPITTIHYSLNQANQVKLKVVDLMGNEIKNLVNAYQEIGQYSVVFDATELASGIYVAKLQIGIYSRFIKMMVVK